MLASGCGAALSRPPQRREGVIARVVLSACLGTTSTKVTLCSQGSGPQPRTEGSLGPTRDDRRAIPAPGPPYVPCWVSREPPPQLSPTSPSSLCCLLSFQRLIPRALPNTLISIQEKCFWGNPTSDTDWGLTLGGCGHGRQALGTKSGLRLKAQEAGAHRQGMHPWLQGSAASRHC